MEVAEGGKLPLRNKLITIAAFAILSTGLIAYSRSHIWNSKPIPRPLKSGHVIEFSLSENGHVYATSVRYVKSNGEFLEETFYLNSDGSPGKRTKLAGTVDRGAVVIDDEQQKLKQVGRALLMYDMTEDQIRANGFVDLEESLLGYKVIVQRRCDDATKECAEFWLAPALGGEPLKFDRISADGGKRTQEATRVRLEEPTFTVPNYPLDTSIQERLQQMRQARTPR